MVLSAASGSVFISLFATVIGAPVGIVIASFGLVFSVSNGTAKKPLKQWGKKFKKNSKIVLLAKSKLYSRYR